MSHHFESNVQARRKAGFALYNRTLQPVHFGKTSASRPFSSGSIYLSHNGEPFMINLLLLRSVRSVSILLIFLVTFSAMPIFGQEAAVLEENPQECVTDEAYEEGVDYFPEKAELTHAETFDIDYFDNYKVITVNTPWAGATDDDVFQYVLVQCGTPAPEDFEDALVIEVPTGTIISMSTSQLPQIVELGLVDQLVGVDSLAFINTPEVVDKAQAGELIEVGAGASVNVELVLDADPSLVMVNGNGIPEYDAHPALLEAGVPVVINADWVETTLLGRAEWIKFMAAFYNQEGEANELYDTIVEEYEAAAALVADLSEDERITVLWNKYEPFTEAWSIPGQQTWLGGLLTDAGVDWVLMEEAPDISGQLSFEQVYEAGLDAPIWVLNTFGISSVDALLAEDERNGDFAAVETGEVYNNEARVNANGGNDFWETGVTHPHLLLQDLIALFYPELLPDHELMFYNKLEQ
jgi:iron complex transport system substrate-binding protein